MLLDIACQYGIRVLLSKRTIEHALILTFVAFMKTHFDLGRCESFLHGCGKKKTSE
jgi:hypothetical protein